MRDCLQECNSRCGVALPSTIARVDTFSHHGDDLSMFQLKSGKFRLIRSVRLFSGVKNQHLTLVNAAGSRYTIVVMSPNSHPSNQPSILIGNTDHDDGRQHDEGSNTKATITAQEVQSTRDDFERLFGVDEHSYEQPTTTRRELWSYYLYYNGNIPLDYCQGLTHKTIRSVLRGQWCRPRFL
jgi:hypothetical protein